MLMPTRSPVPRRLAFQPAAALPGFAASAALPAFSSPPPPLPAVVAPVTCPDKPATAPLALVPTLAWSKNLFARPGITATGQTANDTLATIGAVAGIAGTGLGIYHGWRRTGSVGWTLGWGLFGGLLPIVAIPWMLAQGFAKPAGSRGGASAGSRPRRRAGSRSRARAKRRR